MEYHVGNDMMKALLCGVFAYNGSFIYLSIYLSIQGRVVAQVLFKIEGKNGHQRQLGVHNNRNPVDSKERRVRVGEPALLTPLILPMTFTVRAPFRVF